jgi:hypothetical protein
MVQQVMSSFLLIVISRQKSNNTILHLLNSTPHGVDIVSAFHWIFARFSSFEKKGKRLAPEYEKAATILVKNDPPVALVKVNESFIDRE